MNAYFDTGVIIKLYVQESNSSEAIALVSRYPTPGVWTHWQSLELRTALRLKRFRKEISAPELRRALAMVEEDVRAGRWKRPQYELSSVYDSAEELSRQYTVPFGCRSLDILHVAAAKVVGVRDFLTFDIRQRKLAKAAGLRVSR